IREFDANVEFGKPVTRPLRYISAGDVLPVLVQALTEPGATAQPGAEGGGANPSPQPQAQPLRATSATVANPYSGGISSTSITSQNTETNSLGSHAIPACRFHCRAPRPPHHLAPVELSIRPI